MIATSLQWPTPLYNDHLYSNATSLQWHALYNGYCYFEHICSHYTWLLNNMKGKQVITLGSYYGFSISSPTVTICMHSARCTSFWNLSKVNFFSISLNVHGSAEYSFVNSECQQLAASLPDFTKIMRTSSLSSETNRKNNLVLTSP